MNKKDYETSSGNIFLDIGIKNPEGYLARVNLAIEIVLLIQEKKLTQKEAAKLLGLDQPKISALSKGKLTGFSLDRLCRLLNKLDQNIDIRVTPKTRIKEKPHINVSINKVPRKPSCNDAIIPRPMMLASKKNKKM